MEGGQRLQQSRGVDDAQPLISIITVVFNGKKDIAETILSVKENKRAGVEYIIIDGNSTDGTIDIIQKHEADIDYWISAPDSGIYDALNKGIRAARGHFFFTLNIGDKLLALPFDELTDAKQRDADVALFNVLLSDGRTFFSKIDFRIRFGNTVHHQGAFYKITPDFSYDLTYRIFADFDKNQKLFRDNKKFIAYNKTVSYHSIDGVSHDQKYLREYFAVTRRNFGVGYAFLGRMYVAYGNWKQSLLRTLKK